MANARADLKDVKKSGSTSVVFRLLGIQRISNASDSEVHCSPRQHNQFVIPDDLVVATMALNKALVALNKCTGDAKCTSAALEGSKQCFKDCYHGWAKLRKPFQPRVEKIAEAYTKAKKNNDISFALDYLKTMQIFTPYFISGVLEIYCCELCEISSISLGEIEGVERMISEISHNGCDPRTLPIILQKEICGKDWNENNIVSNEESWVMPQVELAKFNIRDRFRGTSPTVSPRSANAGSRSVSEDESGSDSDSNSSSRPQSADSKVHAKT